MQVTSSYGVEIIGSGRRTFSPTINVYRNAVSYLINVCEAEWPAISRLSTSEERVNAVERLTHATGPRKKRNSDQYTSGNIPKYPFDQTFPKMPSYLRRAAISAAIGAVQSWTSSYDNWVAGGKKGKAPKLTVERHVMPVFFKDNMYAPGTDECTARLKLYNGHDWVWQIIRLKKTDVQYLRRFWTGKKESAPTLDKRYGKYYLRFSFEESVSLTQKPADERRILAVDLGLNTDAVCSVMEADGTVAARKFIDFAAEKDRLYKVLGRIRRNSREHGAQSVKGLWRYARNLNDELAKQIGTAIADYAFEQGCDVIVFEHLDFRGRKLRGTKAQRLSMWRRNGIQDIAAHRAHRLGMRISRVCAWGTSSLAYDGSGRVVRDSDNRAWATFQNGKRYNCDLSASYNIGARYFIRELLKPVSARKRSCIEAKVPDVRRRTLCTLSTLRDLAAVL